jgi:hypothetical protein
MMCQICRGGQGNSPGGRLGGQRGGVAWLAAVVGPCDGGGDTGGDSGCGGSGGGDDSGGVSGANRISRALEARLASSCLAVVADQLAHHAAMLRAGAIQAAARLLGRGPAGGRQRERPQDGQRRRHPCTVRNPRWLAVPAADCAAAALAQLVRADAVAGRRLAADVAFVARAVAVAAAPRETDSRPGAHFNCDAVGLVSALALREAEELEAAVDEGGVAAVAAAAGGIPGAFAPAGGFTRLRTVVAARPQRPRGSLQAPKRGVWSYCAVLALPERVCSALTVQPKPGSCRAPLAWGPRRRRAHAMRARPRAPTRAKSTPGTRAGRAPGTAAPSLVTPDTEQRSRRPSLRRG